jgi:hypothetical protein
MIHVQWQIKRGDLVKISPSNAPNTAPTYGVVLSREPYNDQVALFPVVMVYSFADGTEHQYYPYNLEIVSSTL